MHRKPKVNTYMPQQRSEMERIVRQKTTEARQVERAGIVVFCLDGLPVKQIAENYNIRPNTVVSMRDRFEKEKLKALHDKPCSASLRQHGEKLLEDVLKKYSEKNAHAMSPDQWYHYLGI